MARTISGIRPHAAAAVVTLVAAAVVFAFPSTAGATPWKAAEQVRSSLFEAQAALLLDGAGGPEAETVSDALNRRRQGGSQQQPGEHGDQGRIGRLPTLGQQDGAQASTDRRSDHEAGKRKAAGDQAALVADDRKRQGEDRDDHVDEVHVVTR